MSYDRVMKAWLAQNPKVYSFNCQAIQDQHEQLLKDKKADVYVEQGKPQVDQVKHNTGSEEEHQLIMKNKKTLKGVSRAVAKMRSLTRTMNRFSTQTYHQRRLSPASGASTTIWSLLEQKRLH